MLNEIDFDQLAESELSVAHREEVTRLVESIGCEIERIGRIAPSIITRGEIQVFGCSSPRFANRFYFKNSPGFLNLRRLGSLSESIAGRKSSKSLSKSSSKDAHLSCDAICEALNADQSCIADCLLPVPYYLRKGNRFHLNTVKLSHAYGETKTHVPASLDQFESTPFMKNISLGGGLCSQACCFISSVLLHEFATGIHGLAEITALANSARRNTITLTGLDYRQMAQYFSAVGLSISYQVPHAHVVHGVSNPAEAIKSEFELALRAYSLSRMPIVFPADVGRLLGFTSLSKSATPSQDQSIYAQNGFLQDKHSNSSFDQAKPHRHCFVILGCERDTNADDDAVFLFHDPGAHPFMWAKTTQLASVGTYVRAVDHSNEIDACHFWPVTPLAVKMPLLDYKPVGSFEFRRGLKWLSYWHRKDSLRFPPKPSDDKFNRFLLVQVSQLIEVGNSTIKHDYPFPLLPLPHNTPNKPRVWLHFRKKLAEVASILQDHISWSADHWVWLEIMEDSIWLWDAEIEPVVSDPIECLIAKVVLDGNQISIHWPEAFEID